MTVQSAPPVEVDPDDPVEILRTLPAQYREQFMTEYEAAVAGARQPAHYRRLRSLLRLWRLRAAAYSDPGFEARLAAAQAAMAGDHWDGTPPRDVVPDWDEKIAAARRRAGQ